MATRPGELTDTVIPSAADAELARESAEVLSKVLRGSADKVQLRIQAGRAAERTVTVPMSALRLLAEILTEMAQGNTLSLIPIQAELSTQQAADLLNVSRPYLIEQLEKGAIPFRKIGKHRRVLLQDLAAYKRAADENRLQVLQELAAQAQELGMGYGT